MVKRILMIAGPNGEGKTTTALTLIPNLPLLYEFVNADEIARGLAPLHQESVALAASKLMIQRIKEMLKDGKSFAFETTASGVNYVRHLSRAKDLGYEINLMYIWLSRADLAVQRVIQRVKQGGHNIPEQTIRRRYVASLKNLIKYYLPLADSVLVVDNSSEQTKKLLLIKILGML